VLQAARNKSMPLVLPRQKEGGSTASVVQCVTGLGKGQARASPRYWFFTPVLPGNHGAEKTNPYFPLLRESAPTPSSCSTCFPLKELGRLLCLDPPGEARSREEARYFPSSGKRPASRFRVPLFRSPGALRLLVLGTRAAANQRKWLPWTASARLRSLGPLQQGMTSSSSSRRLPCRLRLTARSLFVSSRGTWPRRTVCSP